MSPLTRHFTFKVRQTFINVRLLQVVLRSVAKLTNQGGSVLE
jgi:hypothetical protein